MVAPTPYEPLPGHTLIALRGRMAAGRRSDPHRHGAGQLLASSQGLLTVGTATARWIVPPGQAVWLPPWTEHQAQSHGPFDGWSLYVAEEACAGLPPVARLIIVPGLLREAVARAAERGTGDHHGPHLDAVILGEIACSRPDAAPLQMPNDARALRVAQAILANPADPREVAAWAAFAGASERTLGRLFLQQTGLPLSDWRRRARLMRAMELLAAGESIGNIGLDVGFTTVSAFIAAFRRQYQMTPASYRAAPQLSSAR